VRLATLAEEKEITVTLGDIMAMDWVNGNRYVEALEICREILQSGGRPPDFRNYRQGRTNFGVL
jgi:hypothetical protein